MRNLLDLSIIIPAYNEESRLPEYLDRILEYMALKDVTYEILVVDDGSTDSTSAVVKGYAKLSPDVKLVRLTRNRGKGYAVKTGMLQARGRLRLFADADGSTPVQELERLEKAIESGFDVAVASRALHDKSCAVKAHLHRKIIGAIFNFIVRALTVKNICDTQCGFKLFKAEAAIMAFPLLHIDGFGFDVEILFICAKNRLRIVEIPVNWSDVKGSKVKLVRDSIRMFCDVCNICYRGMTGAYNPDDY